MHMNREQEDVMQKYGVNELRRMFLEFFESKEHLAMKSFSLAHILPVVRNQRLLDLLEISVVISYRLLAIDLLKRLRLPNVKLR